MKKMTTSNGNQNLMSAGMFDDVFIAQEGKMLPAHKGSAWVLERISGSGRQNGSYNPKIDAGAIWIAVIPHKDFKSKKPTGKWFSCKVLWTNSERLKKYVGNPAIMRILPKSMLHELQVFDDLDLNDKRKNVLLQITFDRKRNATMKEEERWKTDYNKWMLMKSL